MRGSWHGRARAMASPDARARGSVRAGVVARACAVHGTARCKALGVRKHTASARKRTAGKRARVLARACAGHGLSGARPWTRARARREHLRGSRHGRARVMAPPGARYRARARVMAGACAGHGFMACCNTLVVSSSQVSMLLCTFDHKMFRTFYHKVYRDNESGLVYPFSFKENIGLCYIIFKII